MGAQRCVRRAGPDDDGMKSGAASQRVQKDSDALVIGESTDIADSCYRRFRKAGPSTELLEVDAQTNNRYRRSQPAAHGDATGLRVAHRQSGHASQCPPLGPSEREREPLRNVLRGVEHERSGRASSCEAPDPTKYEEFHGRQRVRLLVQVDDVPVLAQCAPQRSWRVCEQVRVCPDGANADDEVVFGRVQPNHHAALIPFPSGEQGHLMPGGDQLAFPLAPTVHNGTVGHAQDFHLGDSARWRDDTRPWPVAPPQRPEAAPPRADVCTIPDRPWEHSRFPTCAGSRSPGRFQEFGRRSGWTEVRTFRCGNSQLVAVVLAIRITELAVSRSRRRTPRWIRSGRPRRPGQPGPAAW